MHSVNSVLCFSIKPLQCFYSFSFCFSLPELFGTEEATNPVTGLHKKDYDLNVITRRNIQLYNRYRKRYSCVESDSNKFPRLEGDMKRIKKSRESLPIEKFR
jgi:hypothetical protein